MTTRKIIIGASIFYVVIAPFFFHPDLKIIYSLAAQLFSGVFNIYARYDAYPQLFPLGPFVYLPLAYFVMGGFYLLARLIAGFGFTEWLTMGNTAVGVVGIYRFILATKLPLIAVHVLSGWLLTKTVAEKNKNLVAWLWFFNPISIYVVAMMGQIDGLAALTIIASLVWAENKPRLAIVSLGLGAAVKAFPLLLMPLFIVLRAKTWQQRLELVLLGALSYGGVIVWYLTTPGFYHQALASNLSKNALTAGIPIFLLIIYGVAFAKHREKIDKLNRYFLLATLIVLAAIQFHPQWALWALPMAVVYVAETKKWWWGGLFAGGWLLNVLSIPDRFLTWGLLAPLDSSVYFLPAPITLAGHLAPLIYYAGKIMLVICFALLGYETVSK